MGLFNIGVEGQYTTALVRRRHVRRRGAPARRAQRPVSWWRSSSARSGRASRGSCASPAVSARSSRRSCSTRSRAILVGYLLDRYGMHGGNSVRTKSIPESQLALVRRLAADGAVWTLGLLAVLVGVGFWMLLNRTRFGFDLRATGASQTAAVACGIDVNRMVARLDADLRRRRRPDLDAGVLRRRVQLRHDVPGGSRLHRHRGGAARAQPAGRHRLRCPAVRVPDGSPPRSA